MNLGQSVVNNWYTDNSLMINKKKSVFIPFILSSSNTPEQILIKSHKGNCKDISISDVSNCNNYCTITTRVTSAKYLGVIFYEHLKWKPHFEMAMTRVKKCFYIFKELQNILDIDSQKLVYFALVTKV